MKFSKLDPWPPLWGGESPPEGATPLGVIRSPGQEAGALFRLADGGYAHGLAGSLTPLDAGQVEEALARSEAASAMGRVTSARKRAAAQANGRRGGRPRKN